MGQIEANPDVPGGERASAGRRRPDAAGFGFFGISRGLGYTTVAVFSEERDAAPQDAFSAVRSFQNVRKLRDELDFLSGGGPKGQEHDGASGAGFPVTVPFRRS
jgi:hypothetical protein